MQAGMFTCLFFGCTGPLLLQIVFLQLWRAGATLCCGVQASHRSYFSCCGAQVLGKRASVVVVHRLSCPVACGIFPDQESNLLSPALAGGFQSTAPPAKPQAGIYLVQSGPQNWVRYTGSAQPNSKSSHSLKFSHLMFMQSPTVTTVAHTHTSSQAHVYTHTHTHTQKLYKHSWFPLPEPPPLRQSHPKTL